MLLVPDVAGNMRFRGSDLDGPNLQALHGLQDPDSPGMAMPPFSVIGIEGACGRIHCTLGSCDHSILATGSHPWPERIHANHRSEPDNAHKSREPNKGNCYCYQRERLCQFLVQLRMAHD